MIILLNQWFDIRIETISFETKNYLYVLFKNFDFI